MNREQAKFILQACHLDGRDAEDPRFREALNLVKCDPELASWFAQEQAADAKLSKAFRTFPVPPDLKGQLLAARKFISPPKRWFVPAWLSAAAVFVVFFGALGLLLTGSPKPEQFAQFRSFVSDTAATLDHLDLETSDLHQIRQWLVGHNAPNDFAVPGKLNGRTSVGCRVFPWHGQKVSLVCFELENQKVAHLFVTDRSALTNLPERGAVQFQTTPDGIATVSWSDARRVYVVAMAHGEEDLKRLFL